MSYQRAATAISSFFLVLTTSAWCLADAARDEAVAPVSPSAPKFGAEIKSDRPVWLEAENKETRRWDRVCDAPCTDVALTSGVRYRVRGEGVRPTRPIEGEPGSKVKLDVRTSSNGTFASAFVLIGVGSLGVIVGSLLSLSASPLFNGDGFGAERTDEQKTRGQVGTALMIGGLVGAAVGGGLVIASARSSLETTPMVNGARHEKESRRERTVPGPTTPFVSVPFFSTTF